MRKEITTTAGYRVEETGKLTRYYSGSTGEGYVYKDEEAFNARVGVVYIPEAAYDDPDRNYVTSDDGEGNLYTYQDLYELMEALFLENDRFELVKDKIALVEQLTAHMFSDLDWVCPETWIQEVDIDEDVEYAIEHQK